MTQIGQTILTSERNSEAVRQSKRRSGNLKAEERLPNLIIGGANKAATTSVYTYLSWHPDVGASRVKETNYFLAAIHGQPLPPIEKYAKYFSHCRDKRYLVEATPRYIYGGTKLASTMISCLGPVRVIFILRDPIDRLISYFKHMKRSNELPTSISLNDYVFQGLQELKKIDLEKSKPIQVYRTSIFVRGVAQGFYVDYLKQWYSLFGDHIKVTFFEFLKTNPLLFMQDLCDWLRLDDKVYEGAHFSIENKGTAFRNQSLHRIAEAVNHKLEAFFRKHHQLKSRLRGVYFLVNEAGWHPDELMISNQTRSELENLYGTYNCRLLQLLKPRGYQRFPTWVTRTHR